MVSSHFRKSDFAVNAPGNEVTKNFEEKASQEKEKKTVFFFAFFFYAKQNHSQRFQTKMVFS